MVPPSRVQVNHRRRAGRLAEMHGKCQNPHGGPRRGRARTPRLMWRPPGTYEPSWSCPRGPPAKRERDLRAQRETMPGFYDTWPNRVKRPLVGLRHRLQDAGVQARVRIAGAIRHVHGPVDVEAAEQDMVVICLLRNGELWVRSFIEHHLALGAKHIFFLDNGSTDGTVARIRGSRRTSLWTTDLPFRRQQLALRRWLFRRFGRGRWCLWCDVDELFDYPFSDVLPLGSFLGYLRAHSFQVVAAQMLDMFSELPFGELESRPDDPLRATYPFYDLTGVRKRRDIYWIDDDIAHHRDLFCTFGGIRGRVFGSHDLLQTKHPLVFGGDGTRFLPYDGHFSRGRVADVSAVLLHYKFVSNLVDYARESVRLKQHSRGSLHYRRFLEVLERDPGLSLGTPQARRLEGVSQLLDDGLLTASPAYHRWVEEHGTIPDSPPVLRPVATDSPDPASGAAEPQ